MEKKIEKQAIEEMAKVIEHTEHIAEEMVGARPSPTMYAKDLYWHGYRKQEWISVEERLPPKNEMVLIFCGGARELDWICSTGLWYDHDHTLVTHWKPLPEPPKMKGGAE